MTVSTLPDGTLQLTCDPCGTIAKPPETFREGQFQAFKRWFEKEGWNPRRRAAVWVHACPACAKFQDRRLL